MVVDGRETGRTVAAFHAFVQRCAPGFPLPGAGDTWRRFEALADVSAEDLSAGRLAEGHVDALAILAEAGRGPAVEGATYGVWAARRPSGGMTARRVGAGWELHGVQEFCSGANLLDRALVAADGPEGQLLFDLSVAESVVTRHAGSWPAVGMAASDSMTLTIAGAVGERDRVGGPGFYTGRRGFWLGAVGVAACWFGGARGLVDGLVATLRADPGPHAAAALGRAVADLDAMEAVLRDAAAAIDGRGPGSGSPSAPPGTGPDGAPVERRRALSVRQTVHDRCGDVLERVVEAGGARMLGHVAAQARRAADLGVYLSQHHGGADAADLGRLVVDERRRALTIDTVEQGTVHGAAR